MRAAVIIVLCILLLALKPASGEGTATPSPPDPKECLIEPRLIMGEDWLRVAGLNVSPSIFPSMTTAAPYPPELPPGVPPAESITYEVERTVRELGACISVRDAARTVSLYTDAYWARIMAEIATRTGTTIEQTALNFAASVQHNPDPDSEVAVPVEYVLVGDTREILDGRVAAFGALVYEDGYAYAAVFVFVEVNDRWLVDDRQMIDFETAATPVPGPSGS